MAEEMGLKNVTMTQGDAFDRASLASLTPKPTIGIVSGLYELFPYNEPVMNSLRGLADAIEPGGYLDLHQPAVASAGRIHRPRADQSRGQTVDHAPAHTGGNG